MNIAKIEENVQKLITKFSEKEFIYSLLLAYGQPKSAITRLKQGTYNLSKEEDEVLWKKKIFFKIVKNGDLYNLIDEAKKDSFIKRQDPRFLILTDFQTLLAVDTKTNAALDIEFNKLEKYFDFFLPLGGLEKVSSQIENPADIKAAEKMAKLYDQIRADNSDLSKETIHELNVFLSRLLFCFFAEDTEIFEKGAFTSSIASHSNPDGSDLNSYLDRLFTVMNSKERSEYPPYLQKFPYVNGGLLAGQVKAPKFTTKSRRLLLECGELSWSEINPDIFGSMIQAVVNREDRNNMGMHYTSVPNIMKVIKPLFLDELYDEFEKAKDSHNKLEKLLQRIYRLSIFDPACGSGNFLIIAYKEIRKLEIEIFKAISLLKSQTTFQFSSVALNQFFGIEIDDFAHEIALLSLWLAEHQMNLLFKDTFGKVTPALPLKAGGSIACGNAALMVWENICPASKEREIIVLGNPPYKGSSLQTAKQKEDMASVFQDTDAFKNLDYISIWFKKGASFIKSKKAKLGFVSTNSICQGQQVELMWPEILNSDLEIAFAHRAFKWTNSAKGKAGVTCVIVGLRNLSSQKKLIYTESTIHFASNINPYLVAGKNIFVNKRSSPLSGLPEMTRGSSPVDDGNLILSKLEKDELIASYPETLPFIKRLLGSEEFLNGLERWCLWITDENLSLVESIPPIKKRIEAVATFRLKSKKTATRELADSAHKFGEIRYRNSNAVVIPRVTSERRKYLPIGFLDGNTVITDLASAVYDAEPFIFAVLSSKMHYVWVKAVAGQLETRIRYSSLLCYNNFPFAQIDNKQKEILSTHVFNILSEREKHADKTIADLYDPNEMPLGLLEAHQKLDLAVERIYRSKPFSSDDERLDYLFKQYEELVGEKDA
jgi:hypothetical protein